MPEFGVLKWSRGVGLHHIVICANIWKYQRLGGWAQPGNRFMSCMRARGVYVLWAQGKNLVWNGSIWVEPLWGDAHTYHTTKVAIPSVCAPFMLPFVWLSDTACTWIPNFPAEENSRKKKQKMTHRDEDDGSEEPQEPEERFQKKNGYHFGVDFGDRIYAHSTHSMLTLHFILHTLRSLKLTLHSLYTPLQLQNKVPMQHDKKTFKSMFPRESLDLQSWSWLIVCQGAWEHTFRNMFWSICQYVFLF